MLPLPPTGPPPQSQGPPEPAKFNAWSCAVLMPVGVHSGSAVTVMMAPWTAVNGSATAATMKQTTNVVFIAEGWNWFVLQQIGGGGAIRSARRRSGSFPD